MEDPHEEAPETFTLPGAMHSEFNQRYEVEETAQYLIERNFTCAALQFPDELLKDSPAVTAALQSAWKALQFKAAESKQENATKKDSNGVPQGLSNKAAKGGQVKTSLELKLYVLADSTYGSCCVDEVAAAHASVQCVVHYGHACMSPTSRLPARFVLSNAPVDVEDCTTQLRQLAATRCSPVLILYELKYGTAVSALKRHLVENAETSSRCDLPQVASEMFTVASMVARDMEPGGGLAGHVASCGLTWELPPGRMPEDCLLVWIGHEGPALTNLLLTYNDCKWARYDPEERKVEMDLAQNSAFLRRRYYLVERAKDASIVGILAGTLGVAGYQEAIAQLRALVAACGKRSYTMLMGRPNPAKLANFPECEVFVLVACPQSALLDSKDYLTPVITPFEAELAFGRNKQWTGKYRLGFSSLLEPSTNEGLIDKADEDENEEPRFSLVTGRLADRPSGHNAGETSLAIRPDRALALQSESGKSLAVTAGSVLAPSSAAEYLQHHRQYRGLEMPPHLLELAGEDASKARIPVGEVVIGRSGRAAGYSGEGAVAAEVQARAGEVGLGRSEGVAGGIGEGGNEKGKEGGI